LYVTVLNRYLWKIVSADKLARTGLDHVIEENLADRIFAGAWFTVIKNGKESCVKLIVENRITGLAHGGAEAGPVANDLHAAYVELGIVLRIKRWIVNDPGSVNAPI
jgi:hypothetical protein